MPESSGVIYSVKDAVATITFSRSEVSNSIRPTHRGLIRGCGRYRGGR
ncbi:MAG: hypothetical protein GX610_21420 [Rhodococcus sp.]|nr:hypothetical protein [Rhodococcus sp. (in: high G+C Gram-positive bacteria)]